jgi:CubicO group peptidase (beta-lactamase class C family)
MKTDRRRFLKSVGLGVAGAGIISWLPAPLLAEVLKAGSLPRSSPEAQGLSARQVLAFVEAVEKQNLGLHSLMVVRHGKVVAEGWWDPYKPDLKHTLFSLSKSFTSTAIGLAVAEGRLTVEDKVISFFPGDKPDQVSQNLAAMRIKDLLTMTSGHEQDTLMPLLQEKEGSWARKFLALPVGREPGTFFVYNTGATYMLSAVLQQLTGQTLLEYLTPRLFKPLGIEGADWESNPEGINMGGFGLRVRTEDIAKFGQLYLQKGRWAGKQVLPASWVAEATAPQVPNHPDSGKNPESDWHQGYGYQFWRCRHNGYRGDGAMGQYCLVLPDQDAVVAITSETADMQKIMNQVWEHLLPHMQAAPLATDKNGQRDLTQKLASLTLLPARAATSPPSVVPISGKVYKIEANALHAQTVSFLFSKNTCTFILKDTQGEHRILCGLNGWAKGETALPGTPPRFTPVSNPKKGREKVAAFGTWTDPNTFVMTWSYFETPHADTVTCQFQEDKVRIAFKSSIEVKAPSRGVARPVLEGQVLRS